jgi:hypothetical protein
MYASWKKVTKSYVKKNPASRVSCKITIHRPRKNFEQQVQCWTKRKYKKCYVLTEDKLDHDTGTQMEISPITSLCCLDVDNGVSKSSTQGATKLLKTMPI